MVDVPEDTQVVLPIKLLVELLAILPVLIAESVFLNKLSWYKYCSELLGTELFVDGSAIYRLPL